MLQLLMLAAITYNVATIDVELDKHKVAMVANVIARDTDLQHNLYEPVKLAETVEEEVESEETDVVAAEEVKPKKVVKVQTAFIMNQDASIRSDASICADTIGSVQKGSTITVSDKELGWYKTVANGVEGYVFSEAADGHWNTVKDNINMKLLSTFTSYYNPSKHNNSHNIELSGYQNSVVVKPGEVFTFNGNTGNSNRTDLGFKESIVVVNGQTTTGVGGGICQTSTNIYNAVLKTEGLQVIERYRHSLANGVGYVPYDMDSAVDYGNKDLKFKNNRSKPVYIECLANHLTGESVVNIYELEI